MKARDYQQKKVYTSEHTFITTHTNSIIKYKTLEEAETFVLKVVNSKWWASRFPPLLTVDIYKNIKTENCWGGVYDRQNIFIELPGWAQNQLYILHELSHCICYIKHKSYNITMAWHGVEFMQCYLQLIQHFLGISSRKAFKLILIENGVKF
jgi:hypothetical protein